MVVNRKQPTAPQPVSRSSSTQHLPTKRHLPTKGTTKPNGSEIDSQPAKSNAHKSRKHHIKKRRPKTLLDRLFFWSLTLFTFYTFYTCRPNPIFSTPLHNQPIEPNLVCRSLHSYRVHILEPYVLPSVKHTLAFTHSIAEPYIASVQRKTDPYIAPVVKATKIITPYVTHAVDTSKAIWKGTFLKYYRIAILPRYRLYIKPRLSPLCASASKAFQTRVSRPLHIRVTRLNRALHARIHPYIGRVQPYVNQAYATIYDVSVQAINIFKTHVQPRLIAAWTFAHPHLCTALKFSKAASVKTAAIAAEKGKIVTREAGAYRRTYVDPHVRKIWDKVAEGTPSASEAVTTPTIITPPPAADIPGTTPEAVESIIQSTSVTAAEELEPTPVAVTQEVVIKEEQVAFAPIPTPEEAVVLEVPAESETPVFSTAVAHETPAAEPQVAAEVSSDAPEPETIPEPTPVESIITTEVPTPEPTPAASQAKAAAESVIVASLLGSTGGEELDLDEFLANLGVEDASESSTVVDDADPTPTEVSPAEASKAEEDRLEKIAAKRNAIVDRHEKWFADLDDLISNETEKLVDVLADWRTAKVNELATLAAGNGTGVPLVEEVQVAGQRLLKGLEGYLRNAETRSTAWKLPPGNPAAVPKEERETKAAQAKAEKEKWTKVLVKVEAKFAETVQTLRAKVHAWFVEEREHESQVVIASTALVKQMAEQAQADLGISYVWLDDVTFQDWQQYHELMSMYERYDVTARLLQNGTEVPEPAPLPPADPIVPALDVLHNELQDVIVGFNVALGPIRGSASHIFGVRASSADDDDDDEDSGFFVVRDGEVRRDDMRGVDFGALGLENKEGAGAVKVKDADEVKILPIGPGGDGEALDPATIFVGKDRVQVEQALGGVPIEPAAVRHEEL